MPDKAHQLLNATSLKELAEVSKDSVRWQIIKSGRARIGAEEVELLVSCTPAIPLVAHDGEPMPDKWYISH